MEVKPPSAPGVWRTRVRQTAIGFNTALTLLLAVSVWAMVNYLAQRHHGRVDVSRAQYHQLHPRTEEVLRGLDREVRAIVFFQPEDPLFLDVEGLLRAFADRTARLTLEFVDPDRDPARAKELESRHKLEKGNAVVFLRGDRSRHVPAARIAEYEKKTLLNPNPRRIAFTAEPHFVAALLSILHDERPILYAASGHGERDFLDETKQHGYAEAARLLAMENLELRKLDLGRDPQVPEDCDLLIIAGPRQEFSPVVADRVRQYLRRNGRLLLLADSGLPTGLEEVLREWGVVLGQDVVIDTRKTLTGRDVYVSRYATHPITAKMKDVTTMFFLPRSVDAGVGGVPSNRPEDQPRLTQLASSSEHGWAERDLTSSPAEYHEGVDRPGPVPIAVAVERGVAADKGVSLRAGRMVVVGDSQFAANAPIHSGGFTFFLNCVNWLVDRADLLDIPIRPVQEVRLNLDRHDLNKLFASLVVGLPAWIAFTGLLVWYRRRR
jgi:ABC-type uncharacterized transport system involved in gliding motility auxiliary subunit